MNLRQVRRPEILAAVLTGLGLLLVVILLHTGSAPVSVPTAAAPEVIPQDVTEPALPVIPEPTLTVTEGKLAQAETLSAALRRTKVDWLVIHQIDSGMLPVFDFRYARPGDHFRLAQDESGALVRFNYDRSVLERYELIAENETFVAERIEAEIETRHARLAGVVAGSLYESVSALGEATELASDFADIFAWDVDFSRSVQRGDEFSILYERRFLETDTGAEVYIGPGRILAARYSNAAGDFHAIGYGSADELEGYYRPDGSSVERQFLRAPLKYRRISSRYTLGRLHPILKIRRPHQGIDYAAPTGTPVWSVASGKVIFRGVQGGFGKLVKVRHSNGYVSYYGHLSRFSSNSSVGSQVQQKQIIGYVGSTGMATGPHLDFRLKQHGRYLNPATLQTPPAKPIPAEAMARFHATRDSLLRELDPPPLMAATNEAM
ncbi:MAG: M23 family metallopeptidase [Deltaproteobacteria bacterium]|nr:M23 family metallopeptidase [Deltaproteobacteria bacterium]MBW2394389.1 M23 family metallopeptidase [Deltaproteobacteria bacterium]